MTLVEKAPYGVIGSITPSTNPTVTIISNSIGMIAAGNAVVFNAVWAGGIYDLPPLHFFIFPYSLISYSLGVFYETPEITAHNWGGTMISEKTLRAGLDNILESTEFARHHRVAFRKTYCNKLMSTP